MYQHLIECKTHAENLHFCFCLCKTCICLKILENIHIPVNMIDRLDITDGFSVKCVFILNTVIFYRRSVKYFIKKILKMQCFTILFIWPRGSE